MDLPLKVLAAAIIFGIAFGVVAWSSASGGFVPYQQSAVTSQLQSRPTPIQSQTGPQGSLTPAQELSELSLAMVFGLAAAATVFLIARRQI